MSRPATADMAAIGLSGLCLVHCLALPLAAASLPLLGAWAEAEWGHLLFAAVAAPLSLTALFSGSNWRLPLGLILLAVTGVGLLFVAALQWPVAVEETPTTVCGSLMIVTAHVLNWRRNARNRACPSPHRHV